MPSSHLLILLMYIASISFQYLYLFSLGFIYKVFFFVCFLFECLFYVRPTNFYSLFKVIYHDIHRTHGKKFATLVVIEPRPFQSWAVCLKRSTKRLTSSSYVLTVCWLAMIYESYFHFFSLASDVITFYITNVSCTFYFGYPFVS